MKLPVPVFLHTRLGREITLAVVLKLVVIAILYYAFFSNPGVPPDADAVAQRLVTPATHRAD